MAGVPKGKKANRVNWAAAARSAKSLAHFIINDSTYRVNLIARARAGTLNSNIEMMLWHYILGKPTETINLIDDREQKDVSQLSDQQLREELVILRKRGEEVLAKDGMN